MSKQIDLTNLLDFDNGKSIIKKIYENVSEYWDDAVTYETVRDALLGRRDPKKNTREVISKSIGIPESVIFNTNKTPYYAIIDTYCLRRINKEF